MSESKFNESESKTQDAKGTSSSADAKSLPPQELSDSEIIDKVQEYFYGNEKLANLFENFVKDGE